MTKIIFHFFGQAQNKKNQKNKLLARAAKKDYLSKLDEFINEWNEIFITDYQYRQTFNIPIFSKQHMETSIFSQMCWAREYIMKLKNNKTEEEKQKHETAKLLMEKWNKNKG